MSAIHAAAVSATIICAVGGIMACGLIWLLERVPVSAAVTISLGSLWLVFFLLGLQR